MTAEIITIGDEILIGQIVDTNSQWLGVELHKIGVSVHQISSIQDDKDHIIEALKEAQKRVDIVIVTGGLGPTKDDITKHAIASYFDDDKMIEYPEVVTHIKQLFQKINHPFREVQYEQARLPSKATLLKNVHGTAPGMWFYENDTVFVSLPGVPFEMKGIITNEVLPRIQKQFQLPFIIHKTILTYGQGESVVAERIEQWEDSLPSFIKLAYLPSFGMVRLRLSAKGVDKHLIEDALERKISELKCLISDIIVGFDDGETIEKKVGEALARKGKTVSTAESLTGGKIASTIVSVSGASSYFKGGIISYTAALKHELLDVPFQMIEEYSVVSK